MSLDVRTETFESLERGWRDLASRSVMASAFATPAWQRAWWNVCSSTEKLRLLSFRRGGEVVGIAPLMESDGYARFIAYSDLCDHHDFVIEPGAEEAFYASLVGAMEEAGWAQLELDGLVEGSPTLKHLPWLAQKGGWRVEERPDGVSPATDLPGTWEEHLQGLGRKDRHELRRKLRRLSGAGTVNCYQVAQAADLPRCLPMFLDLLRASKEEKAAFLTPERERFFYKLAQAMGEEGYLRLFFLELDGVKVAASLCFDYANAYYLYNSGYDTKYAALSVGLLLKALCVQDAIQRGRRRFHFLRGAEGYKYDIGAGDVRLHRLLLRR